MPRIHPLTEPRELLKKYISNSELSEDSKRQYLYPIFQQMFKDRFKIENAANGADGYVDGSLIIECKSKESQWLPGLFQALHYRRKFGLAYHTILVIAHNFVAFWKVDALPEEVVELTHTIPVKLSPNEAGRKNANKAKQIAGLKVKIHEASFYWLDQKGLQLGIFDGGRGLTVEVHEITKILANLEQARILVNPRNFISTIGYLKKFFQNPLEAVHTFYTIVDYWDITSKVSELPDGSVQVTGYMGKKTSYPIKIEPRFTDEFRKFVENRYVFTNEGSGLTVDHYFSRFDEVMQEIDPEFVRQHGIYFTDANLSKFALWFVDKKYRKSVSKEFIVFDPAGGSGNLVSSWRGRIRHKIVSELQPDLLKTIERRMQVDPYHQETGFTIIPKTSENKGLNFLDRSAEDYVAELENELSLRGLKLDKPFAFLLNPPYKNTDENVDRRAGHEANYDIHETILKHTGPDAGNERYLAFLSQILNISQFQHERDENLKPVVMIFTPTSWLIPRYTYVDFRRVWDEHFTFKAGFFVTGREFFQISGRWPLAFTIWEYEPKEAPEQVKIELQDLTEIKKDDLLFDWGDDDLVEQVCPDILANTNVVQVNRPRLEIREELPEIQRGDDLIKQPRLNLYRSKTKDEQDQDIISGFPKKDSRHSRIKAPHGYTKGDYVGFMDDNTPVRIYQDSCNRQSRSPDRVWFRLDNDFKGTNKSKIFSGPADNRSYAAYDTESARTCFIWYAITKATNGRYPIWANQFDIWYPYFIGDGDEEKFRDLSFAFGFAENRCVITKFEAGDPVEGAPEVFVNNPMSPNNSKSFWSSTMKPEVKDEDALELVKSVENVYHYWNQECTKGQVIDAWELKDEPYFRYFSYKPFATKDSGLIQIRKIAEARGDEELLNRLKVVTEQSKAVRELLYKLLVEDLTYFV